MKKILLILFIVLSLFGTKISFAWDLNIWLNNTSLSETKNVSVKTKTWDVEDQLKLTAENLLKTRKIIIWRLIVAYIIYAWVMMVISMWEDEEKLSSAKRQIWYAVVALIFINIPWALYNAFSWKDTSDTVTWEAWNMATVYDRNIFMNSQFFWEVIWSIITFMQITIVAIAVIIFVYEWVKLMFAHWDEERASEAKNKIFYSVLWLVFIWVMEVWRNVMYSWNFNTDWRTAFAQLANLALFFARPVAVVFVTMAWYYYITRNWDEEKVNKAKSIIINTLIGIVILIWIYTILLDLKSLNI